MEITEAYDGIEAVAVALEIAYLYRNRPGIDIDALNAHITAMVGVKTNPNAYCYIARNEDGDVAACAGGYIRDDFLCNDQYFDLTFAVLIPNKKANIFTIKRIIDVLKQRASDEGIKRMQMNFEIDQGNFMKAIRAVTAFRTKSITLEMLTDG